MFHPIIWNIKACEANSFISAKFQRAYSKEIFNVISRASFEQNAGVLIYLNHNEILFKLRIITNPFHFGTDVVGFIFHHEIK